MSPAFTGQERELRPCITQGFLPPAESQVANHNLKVLSKPLRVNMASMMTTHQPSPLAV